VNLPSDYARCKGVGNDMEGWRDGCEHCLRRTSRAIPNSTWIEPPGHIVFMCEYLVDERDFRVRG